MKICIFEDKKYQQLYPLTYLRAIFELKCGHALLADKIKRRFKTETFCYFVREELAPGLKSRVEDEAVNDLSALQDDVLLINGRWLASENDNLAKDGPEEVGISDGDIVYIRAQRETLEKHLKEGSFLALLDALSASLAKKDTSLKLISYPWDLVNHNSGAIGDDFATLTDKGISGEFSEQAVVYGDKDKVFVAATATVHPFVVLDTKHGPIIIDEGAEIHPFTRIEGPSCIGKDSLILGAKIREGTAIGPTCRVGGEVEESIMHGYSNKFHDGFLGHAYVCEWVNIGALGTNSDLKNDYSSVQVYIQGKLTDTGLPKVGCFIGDHSKTSIGTLLNTGSVIGVMTNVVGSGSVQPKFIPSFIWYMNDKAFKGYGFKMMMETAKAAMSRRGRELTEADMKLLEHTYQVTREERDKLIKKERR